MKKQEFESSLKLKFSIITVCLNAEKAIRGTIESVLNQDWKNFEYIIVDGASTDETIKIIEEYASKDKRIRWYSQKDRGIYNAMNKGIHYAAGNFLYFLNAGDILFTNDVLRKVADKIVDLHPDIIIGDIVRKTEKGLKRDCYAVGNELAENLKNSINVCHQAIFASIESLKEGFDEQYKICADYDWLCRQVADRKKIEKIDLVIADFDMQGISSESQYRKILLEEVLSIPRKYYHEEALDKMGDIESLCLENFKRSLLYKCMNQFLILKQKGIDISNFFSDRGIYTIAIYGVHYLGQRLRDELEESKVKVKYAIDKKTEVEDWQVPIFHPDENLPEVDAIIITPVFDFLEIKQKLSVKMECPIISIEALLFYKY